MIIRFYVCIFFFFCLARIEAQSTAIHQDALSVDVNQNYEILLIHKILPKETLYSIARYYRVPLSSLMSANGISEGQSIAVESQLRIPIDNEYIVKAPLIEDQNWIPVKYKVKKKETLYTIAKKYFPQSMEALNERNEISSFIINEGQEITVGWWLPNNRNQIIAQEIKENDANKLGTIESNSVAAHIIESDSSKDETMNIVKEKAIQLSKSESIPAPIRKTDIKAPRAISKAKLYKVISIHTPKEDVVISDDKKVIISTDTLAIEPKIVTSKKGLCLWMKNDPETTELLAFHRTAKIGSTIQLYYPLTQQSVSVEVIDNIKSDLYPDDIEIIVTKAVALQLGARDSRIQIKMDYYE